MRILLSLNQMKSKPELWALLPGFAWMHAAIVRL